MTRLLFRIRTSADADRRVNLGTEPALHNDCACEGSNEAGEDATAHLAAGDRPRPCPDLYQDATTLPGRRIVFNPIAGQGVCVLDAAAAHLLDLADGRRTAAEIVARGAPPGREQAAWTALRRLITLRLLYSVAMPPQPMPRLPTHMGVWLHVSNQCNLRCSYCYLGKTNEQLSLALGQRALRAVFDAARPRGIRHLTLKYAGGEALLEANRIWALDAAARTLAGADITVESLILTNGTLLRPALVAELRARDFGLAISLDGVGAAHDGQRPLRGGQPSFRLVQRGIDAAVAAGVPLNISVVVGPRNLAALPDLLDYLLDRSLPFSLSFVRDSPAAQVGLAAQSEALIAGMEAAYARIAARPPSFSVMNRALDRVQLEYPHFAACGIGESYVVINHTGEVASCQMHLDRPAGHLREGNVLHLVARRTPERPPGTTIDDHVGCATCRWRYRCAGGCPIVTYQAHGRADVRSPFCGVYQALIPPLVALEGLRVARYTT
jgi:uncharacterized protein